MAKKNKKVKSDNIFILVLTILLIALIISLGILIKKTLNKPKSEVIETKVVDKLDEYGYYLTDHNTDYYKEIYNELKDLLSGNSIDEEKYVSLIAELYTIDFYDLNSKLSKSDVGGVQFISEYYQDTFIKTASGTNGIYYYVKSDLYGDRKQDLPIVEKVEILSTEKQEYKYDKINDTNAYKVVLSIEYKEDLGYPKTVSLIFVHNGKKLEIAEVK